MRVIYPASSVIKYASGCPSKAADGCVNREEAQREVGGSGEGVGCLVLVNTRIALAWVFLSQGQVR